MNYNRKRRDPMTRPTITGWIAFIFLLLCSATGCAPAEEQSPVSPMISPPSTRFALSLDGSAIRAELAVTQEEMRRGLMFRESMAKDVGMLFVYDAPRQLSFWMRNTRIPLDIGYFDADGILLEVYRMYPHAETSVLSLSDEAQFALEMNQGWFMTNRIKPGSRLNLANVAAALEARGFDPKQLLRSTAEP